MSTPGVYHQRNTLTCGDVITQYDWNDAHVVASGTITKDMVQSNNTPLSGQVLTWDGSVNSLSWTTGSPGSGLSDLVPDAGGNISGTLTALGSVLNLQWGPFVLAVGRGGTGNNTFNSNELLVGDGSNPITTISMGPSGTLLSSAGSSYGWVAESSLPTGISNLVSDVNISGTLQGNTLTLQWNSPLNIIRGGTGGSFFDVNSLILGNGVQPFNELALGASGTFLNSTGNVMQWIPVTQGTGGTTTPPHPLLDGSQNNDTIVGSPVDGDLVYGSGTSWKRLPLGVNDQVPTALSGTIVWRAQQGGGGGSANPHALLDANINSDTVVGSPTLGDIITVSGTNWQRYGVGPETASLQVVGGRPAWRNVATASGVYSTTNDTNVTLTYSGNNLKAGWTSTLAASRLNANTPQTVTNDTNVTGSIGSQILTLGWTGRLGLSRFADGSANYYLKGSGTSATPYYDNKVEVETGIGLPSSGNQGRLYQRTSDNTLWFDTGSSWVQA